MPYISILYDFFAFKGPSSPISELNTIQITFEPCHEKTCLRVSDQVRHKLASSATEAR